MSNVTTTDAPIVAETASSCSMFFGFHDISPWNRPGSDLVLLREPANLKNLPTGNETAEVLLWNPTTGRTQTLAETNAWNYQQGARQQWLDDKTILYNAVVDGAASTCIRDVETGISNTVPFATAALAADGDTVASVSFGRLAKHFSAYGYAGLDERAFGTEDTSPSIDGLWIGKLSSGKRQLAVAIADLARISNIPKDISSFVSHPLFSPDSKHVAFLHRFFSKDHALVTYLFSLNLESGRLIKLASEKVSHFCWLSNDSLFAWTRFANPGVAILRSKGYLTLPVLRTAVNIARKFRGSLKARLLSEHYHVLSLSESSKRIAVGAGLLTEDGHPMLNPNLEDVLVADTYPDKFGNMELFVYGLRKNLKVRLALVADGTSTKNSDLKCDLHPRWSPDGEKVAVDVCINGKRRVRLYDATSALSLLR